MRGDYSRVTFDPAKHFSGVRLQQGRVQLDADFNEHVDIEAHRDAETTRDVVGRAGAPYDGGGFLVQVATNLRGVGRFGSKAYAVGDDALLVESTNDGPWTLVTPPAGTDDLQAITLTDADTGFAVGRHATILQLSSGGWTKQPPPTGITADLHDVAAVGQEVWAVGDPGTILYRDASGSWASQSVPEGVEATLRGVDFYDGDHGWIVGDGGTILFTEDGTTWTRQDAPPAVGNLHSVAAIDATHAYAVGEGGAIIAWDGQQWKPRISGVSANLTAVRFHNANSGIALGYEGTIVTTENGGDEWTREEAPEGDYSGLALEDFHGYAVGNDVSATRVISDSSDIPTQWVPGPALPEDGRSLTLSAGDLYVEGMRVVNERAVTLTAQPDLTFSRPPATIEPVFPPLAGARTYGVYLEAFEEHVTALERAELREIALGGPDTATRTRMVWQAKLLELDLEPGPSCDALAAGLPPGIRADARLRARAEPAQEPEQECALAVGGGYRRLENQLYRVEIHRATKGAEPATFKWSRDNGMVAARLEALDEATASVTVSNTGRDDGHGFGPRQWIEINDESRALRGQAGEVVQVKAVRGDVLEVDLTGLDPGALTMARFPVNPTVHRWDGRGNVTTGTWLDLEDGVAVEFAGTQFETGDHWLIPARSLNGAVEWPRIGGRSRFQEPAGPRRSFGALALVSLDENGMWSNPIDCRKRFPPLTGLIHFFYVGGDGQEAMPDLTASAPHFVKLDRPLQVGVSNWRWPVSGAQVRFDVVEGGGRLNGTTQTSVTTPTDSEGIAQCDWHLNGSGSAPIVTQQVRATLLDEQGVEMQTPIVFNASLSVASEVAYDPAGCGTLNGDKTVQAAISKLTRLARIFPVSGNGFDLGPNETTVSLEVIVVSECGPVAHASVDFVAAPGNGSVTSPAVTNAQGRATAIWTVDPATPTQRVRAVLANVPTGAVKHVPVETTFVANLNLASDTAYTPTCDVLAGAATVQDAIDTLATLPRLYHVTGDGSHASPGDAVPLEVGVASDCGPDDKDRVVEFILHEGDGALEGTAGGIVRTENGRARCSYRMGEGKRHIIEARLRLEDETTFQPPVFFTITRGAEMSTGIPETRLFNFVDTPATLVYNQSGEAPAKLDPQAPGGFIIDAKRFRTVSLRIGQARAKSFSLFMGKISGSTLSVENKRSIDGMIHSFEIVGPEITLWLKDGPPNETEHVQLWVYLRS